MDVKVVIDIEFRVAIVQILCGDLRDYYDDFRTEILTVNVAGMLTNFPGREIWKEQFSNKSRRGVEGFDYKAVSFWIGLS
jgi:hypothetical protein